jgi:hypothetical protein
MNSKIHIIMLRFASLLPVLYTYLNGQPSTTTVIAFIDHRMHRDLQMPPYHTIPFLLCALALSPFFVWFGFCFSTYNTLRWTSSSSNYMQYHFSSSYTLSYCTSPFTHSTYIDSPTSVTTSDSLSLLPFYTSSPTTLSSSS